MCEERKFAQGLWPNHQIHQLSVSPALLCHVISLPYPEEAGSQQKKDTLW